MHIRILIISGPDQNGSGPRPSTESARQMLVELGAVCDLWNLGERPIATTDPASIYPAHAPTEPDHPARTLMRMVRRTDGILILAAERHGSVDGMVKCALDVLSPAEFDRKPVGMIVFARNEGGRSAGGQLAQIVEAAGATPVPHSVVLESGGVPEQPEQLAQLEQNVHDNLATLVGWATQSRVSRTDIDTYHNSPVMGHSHVSVRPLSEQPDSRLAWDYFVSTRQGSVRGGPAIGPQAEPDAADDWRSCD